MNKIFGIIWIGLMVVFITFLTVPNMLKAKEVSKKTNIIKIYNNDLKVHEVIGTIYNAVESQCDADPLVTADNSKINLKILKTGSLRWVALSRDLLKRWGGPYNYGDTINVYHTDSRIRGKWVVHDTMNARFKKRIDFLVDVKHNRLFPHKSHHILISNTTFYATR